MKLVKLAVILVMASLMVVKPANSEETRHFFDASVIPVEGSSKADFVPEGWVIESSIEGDINGDSKSDVVITLIESLAKATEKTLLPAGNRVLMILMQSPKGAFHRLAVAKRLLRCSACYGAMAGPEGGKPEITIVKGVIIVEDLWGSRDTVTTRLRFRYDHRSKRVLLIGEDIENSDRATGLVKRTSSNFLTGNKIKETERFDNKSNQPILLSKKKQRIPISTRYIEDIDFEKY
jgi:hypothetical protein